MRWTEQQLRDYEARMHGARQNVTQPIKDRVEHEDELHYQIIDYCKSKGWLYLHGSMAHKTFRTLGEPDFVIVADRARFFLVECKANGGKLSTDQLGFAMHAQKLGHEVHLVRSYEQFLEVVQ